MRGKLHYQKKVLTIPEIIVFACLAIFISVPAPSMALDYDVEGKTLSLTGIVKQQASYGVGGNGYDTQKGFQAFLTQIILETTCKPSENLKFFASGKYNADQAYWVLSHDNDWRDKDFNKSRSELGVLTDWQDVLGEAHVTWTNGILYMRLGKQVVAWGETDGFRLMDQINPFDQRRGITDVEFENSIIPTWLVRFEYRPETTPGFLQDLNYQFIFNPNPIFRGNERIVPGNDAMGIWAPDVQIPLGGAYPFDYAHLGSLNMTIDEPSDFSREGFAYAGKMMVNLWDARISLNGYYGRSLDFVSTSLPLQPEMSISRFDNRLLISPYVEGYYPYFKFAGGTFSKDLEFLKSSALGGVSPVLRFETFYAFNSTFVTSQNTLAKYDELRWAVGMDWKVKIPLLNPKAYFMISPQVYDQRIINYPEYSRLAAVKENNWMTSIMLSTSYFHTKLLPSFFWLRDWTSQSEFYRYQVIWEHSNFWKFTLGALFVNGSKVNNLANNMQPLADKDNIYFNVAFKF
jgi:hypothetical protein